MDTIADVAGANGVATHQITPNEAQAENTIRVARQIVKRWPQVQERLQQRQNLGNSPDFSSVDHFNDLISFLDQFSAERKGPSTRTETSTSESYVLPLQRYLDEKDDWQVNSERDSTAAVSNNATETNPQDGFSSATTERPPSPCASNFSLVTDSALSTAVSDDTIVLDTTTILNNNNTRKQLDNVTLRDLNEKLCRTVTSSQTANNIIARASDLLSAGADVNARDEWCEGTLYDQLWKDYQSKPGWVPGTVLYAAVSARADCDVLRLLLNRGAEPNLRGGFNGTPLQAIVQTDEKDIARLLLNRGADINPKPAGFGCPILVLAARYGTLGPVELLLERGAQATQADSSHATALHAAAHRGHVGMIKRLLDHGALIDATTRDKAWTPLFKAVHMGHEVAAQTLLTRGADPRLLGELVTTYGRETTRERLMEMLAEHGVMYTCSGVSLSPAHVGSSKLYELVRKGSKGSTTTTMEGEPSLRGETLAEMTEEKGQEKEGEVEVDDEILSEKRSKGAEFLETELVDRNRAMQAEETESVVSDQTTSTAKTEGKRRRKFWSRFSSQTTLHGN